VGGGGTRKENQGGSGGGGAKGVSSARWWGLRGLNINTSRRLLRRKRVNPEKLEQREGEGGVRLRTTRWPSCPCRGPKSSGSTSWGGGGSGWGERGGGVLHALAPLLAEDDLDDVFVALELELWGGGGEARVGGFEKTFDFRADAVSEIARDLADGVCGVLLTL
jgi:hypothetical protein